MNRYLEKVAFLNKVETVFKDALGHGPSSVAAAAHAKRMDRLGRGIGRLETAGNKYLDRADTIRKVTTSPGRRSSPYQDSITSYVRKASKADTLASKLKGRMTELQSYHNLLDSSAKYEKTVARSKITGGLVFGAMGVEGIRQLRNRNSAPPDYQSMYYGQ